MVRESSLLLSSTDRSILLQSGRSCSLHHPIDTSSLIFVVSLDLFHLLSWLIQFRLTCQLLPVECLRRTPLRVQRFAYSYLGDLPAYLHLGNHSRGTSPGTWTSSARVERLHFFEHSSISLCTPMWSIWMNYRIGSIWLPFPSTWSALSRDLSSTKTSSLFPSKEKCSFEQLPHYAFQNHFWTRSYPLVHPHSSSLRRLRTVRTEVGDDLQYGLCATLTSSWHAFYFY